MKQTSFNDHWVFQREGDSEFTPVTLPHDAMIFEKRSADRTAGLGYFPGGTYRYRKTWYVAEDERTSTQILEFEGVYQHASVTVNGQDAAYHAYGYTGFYIDLAPYLRYGTDNEIEVIADNSRQPNSRWYSGSGIYRKVSLWRGGAMVLRPDAVRIRAVSHAPAVIEAIIDAPAESELRTEILWKGQLVAEGLGATVQLHIPNAHLWSEASPVLYEARVTLLDGGTVMDQTSVMFGIRTLQWDANHGLQVNGQTVKLRGACIHHDNGVIGACAFDDAEARKVRILKDAGFNAIRSAHNPCSKALLDACDRYGMYVMDEAFDCWTVPKNSKDYAIDFKDCFRDDLRAMVCKDYNHPSVILYSIGNETVESATQKGVALMGQMRDVIRGIDDTRPITCGISITQNIDWQKGRSEKGDYMGGIEKTEANEAKMRQAERLKPWMLPAVNLVMKQIYRKMDAPLATDVGEEAVQDACGQLDIAGYNYGEAKTVYDDQHAPQRVVVSSETHHTELFEHWQLIERNPRLVGDFMWVGWDYIGEAGVGALGYASRGSLGFDKPYPHLTSGSGIIDITGFLRPEVYWTQMIWGQCRGPVIAVEPLEFAGEPYMMTYWNDTEAVSSWTWPGYEGKRAVVKVYTPDAFARLRLNGRDLGRKKVRRNMAVFHVRYRAGVLEAVTYDETGHEREKNALKTAQKDKQLRVETDVDELRADGQSLAYLNISIVDRQGIVHTVPERELSVTVSGAGRLQGLGSGAICTEDSFTSGQCHTFRGRALAVIRAGQESGEITVNISSGKLEKTIKLECSAQFDGDTRRYTP